MLAHILGRLPCPEKTPRKIWRSIVSASPTYRMEKSTRKRLQSHQLPNEKSHLPAQAKDRKSHNSKRYIAESPTALQMSSAVLLLAEVPGPHQRAARAAPRPVHSAPLRDNVWQAAWVCSGRWFACSFCRCGSRRGTASPLRPDSAL